MPANRIILIVLSLAATWLSSTAWAADCLPRKTAPGIFEDVPRAWGNDSGPIVTGFLDFRSATDGSPVEHGVDLSHNNDAVLYEELRRCGATFAIVKMDNAFTIHSAGLSAQGIDVIPYHYLSVYYQNTDYKRVPGLFSGPQGSDLQPADTARLHAIATTMGRAKAQDFASDYRNRVPASRRMVDLAGMRGQIIALDVEETFPNTMKSTPIQKKNFGRFYAAMLSAWVNETHEQFPDAIIVFYTFPDVFTSYLQYALSDDYATIHGLPVWLARTRADASDFDLTSSKDLQRICTSTSAGNRCIIHQYTHRGVFGVRSAPSARIPNHIDLDRLFSVSQVRDSAGIQLYGEHQVHRPTG